MCVCLCVLPWRVRGHGESCNAYVYGRCGFSLLIFSYPSVATCKGAAAGDWTAALEAILFGLADAELPLQRLLADSLALLLHSRALIDAATMLRLCELLVADRVRTPVVGMSGGVVAAVIPEEEAAEAPIVTTRGAVLAFEALSSKFGPRMLLLSELW